MFEHASVFELPDCIDLVVLRVVIFPAFPPPLWSAKLILSQGATLDLWLCIIFVCRFDRNLWEKLMTGPLGFPLMIAISRIHEWHPTICSILVLAIYSVLDMVFGKVS